MDDSDEPEETETIKKVIVETPGWVLLLLLAVVISAFILFQATAETTFRTAYTFCTSTLQWDRRSFFMVCFAGGALWNAAVYLLLATGAVPNSGIPRYKNLLLAVCFLIFAAGCAPVDRLVPFGLYWIAFGWFLPWWLWKLYRSGAKLKNRDKRFGWVGMVVAACLLVISIMRFVSGQPFFDGI